MFFLNLDFIYQIRIEQLYTQTHNESVDLVFDYKVPRPNPPLFAKSLLLVSALDHWDISAKVFEVVETRNQYLVQKELKNLKYVLIILISLQI